jgi:hypothetical protein
MNHTMRIVDLVEMYRNFDQAEITFVPEKFQLGPYEQDAMPGVIGKFLNYGIERARTRWMVGCVRSFDVIPYQRADPVVVVCPSLNMADYYLQWVRVYRADRWKIMEYINEYDAAVEKAIRSGRELTRDEIYFALSEMLHFRNQMIGRAQ